MHPGLRACNEDLPADARATCGLPAAEIGKGLPEAEGEAWHGHPVWFPDGNPVAGCGSRKDCVRLLFRSRHSLDEAGLQPEGSFKATEARPASAGQVDRQALQRWLGKSRDIQWDYRNIVERKGRLERLK